ncbi:hypothetical protein [Amycolatopsis pithecellobii]|uniref:Uncharacterized protein n=1 Tax=Amycolatopsis pithecellobii TaxID=664692 RepID=A0A6N7ZCF4_9PSEU|nr:hypothetical protein [Amycolatopsis pithecellobii]MTD59375.1 hypothetical protein [Amycolatopsis pithecellobii]
MILRDLRQVVLLEQNSEVAQHFLGEQFNDHVLHLVLPGGGELGRVEPPVHLVANRGRCRV